MKRFPSIKPRLTDSVLTALIQNRLSEVKAVDLGVILVDSTNLKVRPSYVGLSYF